MAVVNEMFQQPAQGGVANAVRVSIIGDPILMQDELVIFLNYGTYRVSAIIDTNGALIRNYDLRLISKSTTAPVPVGTPLILENEGVTYSALAYNPVTVLSFWDRDYRKIMLTGNILFGAQRHAPARALAIVIQNNNVSHTLTFPNSWNFIGAAGRPTSIDANKIGVLSITCLGTSDADVYAVWAVN